MADDERIVGDERQPDVGAQGGALNQHKVELAAKDRTLFGPDEGHAFAAQEGQPIANRRRIIGWLKLHELNRAGAGNAAHRARRRPLLLTEQAARFGQRIAHLRAVLAPGDRHGRPTAATAADDGGNWLDQRPGLNSGLHQVVGHGDQ